MTAVPFDWIPSATPEPERQAPSWAMNATSATRRTRTIRGAAPASLTPVGDGRQDLAVVEPVDRLPKRVGEGGPDGDHDLERVRPRPASPTSTTIGSVPVTRRESRRIDDVRKRLQRLPARPLEPVAGAGPGVQVRVVHRRADVAVLVHHRGGLEIVGRDALPLHPDDGPRDVVEAGAVEGQRDSSPETRRSSAASAASTSAARSRSGMSPAS